MNRKTVSKTMLALLLLSIIPLAFNIQSAAARAGDVEWARTYGGTYDDVGRAIVKTSDGGYAIAGYTYSYGAGSGDFWLVKTDASGNTQWSRTYGGTNTEWAYSVIQTSDGGYAIAGCTYSYGAGRFDFWLVKVDSSGNQQWSRTYGGTYDDTAYSVIQTSDGGYALAGYTYSYGAGSSDFRLVKTDSSGNAQWSKNFGGTNEESAYSVVQTSDGGYALAGETASYGAGGFDMWFVKTDSSGNTQWSRTYGGAYTERARSIVKTSDGGYALAGYTTSYGAGSGDFYLVKTDASGNAQWTKTYGGTNSESAYSVIQTGDRGYALAGETYSYGAGSSDFYLVKTDSSGNTQWSTVSGGSSSDVAYSFARASDGGYALCGYTLSYGAGYSDFRLVKVGGPEWTFMVYLDADNNLESAGIDDFLEMSQVGSTKDVDIVVQFDRRTGYDTSYGDWTDCRRFYITQGLTPLPGNAIETIGEVHMGDPNTLINFVQWTTSRFPAKNYIVVLWDHGGGCLGGICYDDSHGGNPIDMAELKQAMTSIRSSLGKNINILGCDACLMQMIEVAYQVRDTIDVIVGSEEVIPWDGWPYNDILANLTASPSVTPATFATNIVHLYVMSYQGGSQGTVNYVTMSAFYEGSVVVNLTPTVSSFADCLIENLPSYTSKIIEALDNAEYYYDSYYRDLYDFAYEIKQRVPSPSLQTAAQNVMDKLVEARIEERHGPSHPQSHGLSTYLTKSYSSSYDNLDFAVNTHWDEFLKELKRRYDMSYTLTISVNNSNAGTTSPAPGTYSYRGYQTVTVTAYPNSGYYFSSWRLDGTYYYSNPINVYMDYKNHTLICYMYYQGGGGCPALFTWSNSDYAYEGLLDIHNSEGIDVLTSQTLASTPERVHGAFLFRLVEHPQTISHIDQVKLYAVLQNGRTVELPMISATHSEYGNVLLQLLFSDDWKAENKGANHNGGTSQYIQLKFVALPPSIKVTAFIFQIEGNNQIIKELY